MTIQTSYSIGFSDDIFLWRDYVSIQKRLKWCFAGHSNFSKFLFFSALYGYNLGNFYKLVAKWRYLIHVLALFAAFFDRIDLSRWWPYRNVCIMTTSFTVHMELTRLANWPILARLCFPSNDVITHLSMLGWRFWSSLFTAQTRGAAALHCLKSCQFYSLLGGIGLLSGTRQARRVQQLLLICSEMTSSKQTTGVAYLRPLWESCCSM